MKFSEKSIAFYTIARIEMFRVIRLWAQTLLPAAITTILYYVIFGNIIGRRVGLMQGHSYIQFIAPGLVMMQIIMSAYGGSVSSFFMAKFHRNIEEMLVSPMSNILILLGYMAGGVLRAILVGLITSAITLFFTHLHVYSIILILLSALLAACIFSLAGLINAVYAKTFDDISIIPNFVLTPLTYLGGVFYSVSLLPEFWQKVSYINPIVYIISTFRYGFLHMADSHILRSYIFMIFLSILLFFWAILLFKKATNLRQ